jgi:DNA helicase-2/ATP-dependent DNA helicase PcrA
MSSFTGTLNLQQREAATHIHGPLLILAGAGTGKTRVITARIAHMINEGIAPGNILAVTFTNKAAAEMRERVRDMVRDGLGRKVVLGTFHAFCVRFLREFAGHVGYKSNFVIYSQSEQTSLMKRVLSDLTVAEESADPAKILARVSQAKNSGQSLGDPASDLAAAAMEEYCNQLRALNAMDFDDILLLGVRCIEENDDVREALQSRHRYVMVDEFQDTNSLQMRLLRALVPAPFNVCVVGDDDQSIYGWRGAEITNITEFESFFPNPHVVKLEENYRSTTPILHTANSLIVRNAGRRPKKLWSRNPGNEPVRLVVTQDDKEEAVMIAREIQTAHDTRREEWEEFAVLFRTNDQSRVLEQQFRQHKIPYRVVGARSFFDRREVKDILCYLRMIQNPLDDISLLRVLNTPSRGIGAAVAEIAREHSMSIGAPIWVALCDPAFLRQVPQRSRAAVQGFTELVNRYHQAAGGRGTLLAEMTGRLLQDIGYLDYLKRSAKNSDELNSWEGGVRELLSQLEEFDQRNRVDGLPAFLDEVSLNDEREDRRDDITKKKGVCLITLHASKGLEFPVVYLPGMEKDIMPHRRAHEENRVDEERRLLYVGITRAQKRLTLSLTQSRTKWGKPQSSLPSPFLAELDRTHVQEFDYSRHMREQITAEESKSFFANLRAQLRAGQE